MSTTTDKHTDNIVIGSGEMFIDLLDDDDKPTGERYLGDGAAASLSVTTERMQVFSGTGPVAKKLVDKVRSLTRSMSITLHDMSPENLALFIGGEAPADITETAAAVTDETLTVKKGHWYQLGVSDDKPTGVGAIASAGVTVKKGTSGNTAATVKIDYTIDADRGRIYIDPKGGIADGKIRVSYTPVAASRKQVKTGDLREIRAAVRYIEDTDTGKGRNYYAPLCSVGAAGEMALMSRDTEQQIQLACEILEPGSGKAALLIDGVGA